MFPDTNSTWQTTLRDSVVNDLSRINESAIDEIPEYRYTAEIRHDLKTRN
jgi:hypothetical protein